MRVMMPLTIALLSAVPAAAATPCAGEPGAGRFKLNVVATAVRDARGEMAFSIYPDQSNRFLKKGAKVAGWRVPASVGTVTGCAWLAPGTYAIALYHDANDDHHFNRTLVVPKEGYGFSNDAPTTFGLPSFAKVRIAVGPAADQVRIRMRYP